MLASFRVAVQQVGLCILAMQVACPPPPSPTQTSPDDLLTIVDLSPSVSAQQRANNVDLVTQLLRRQAPRTNFTVYALQRSMGSAKPLVAGSIPDPITTTNKIEASAQFNGWQTELVKNVDELVALDEKRPRGERVLNSCYIASGEFAADFFRPRGSSSTHRLVWIGDLAEDCLLPDYRRFSVVRRSDALKQVGEMKASSLQNVKITAVITARNPSDPLPEVDAHRLEEYWRTLTSRFGVAADSFEIGTPAKLWP